MTSLTDIDEEEVHTLIVIPPDGGWGYVVILSAFVCMYLIEGVCYSFGVFLDPLSNEFGTGMGSTSFIGSAISSVSALVAPLVSACLNNYDARCICLVACFLSGLAYAISAVTTHFIVLFLANGILLGIGFGMLYIPALIMPNIYFTRYRAIAVAISSCGSGIGSLSLPQATIGLVQVIGWRNTYFCMIGLVALCAIASLAFIPLKPMKIRNTKTFKTHTIASRMNLKKQHMKCSACCRWRNTNFPTAGDLVLDDKTDLSEIRTDVFEKENVSDSSGSDTMPTHSKTAFLSAMSMTVNQANTCFYSFMSVLCSECCQTDQRAIYRQDIFYQGSVRPHKSYKYIALGAQLRLQMKKRRKQKEEKIKVENEKKARQLSELKASKKELQEEKAKVLKERQRCQEELDKLQYATDKPTRLKRISTLEKIKGLRVLEKRIDREMQNINDMMTSPTPTTSKAEKEDEIRHSLMRYNMSVTHVTTDRELYETSRCSCNVASCRALTTILDFHALRSVAFNIICLNGFFFSLGYYIPWVFLAERAEDYDISSERAITLITMIGTANTIGRFLSGLFSLCVQTNYAVMIGVCCIIQGLLTIISGYFMAYWAQVVYSLSFGFLAAPMQALKSLMLAEIFGIERLSNLYGLQLVGYGIAALIGPPLAGFLRDSTHDYTYSFYFSGSCLTLSGTLLLFILPVRKWELNKEIVDF